MVHLPASPVSSRQRPPDSSRVRAIWPLSAYLTTRRLPGSRRRGGIVAAAMPLQNRVTPFGDLIATEARGLLMGNRGRLHDAHRRIVRTAQGRRWIACVTSFRGRRRTVMTPGLYTELFFLDEAVALAAGHRPCAECRRDDYVRFRAAWAARVAPDTSANAMDLVLHADRLDEARRKRTYRAELATLPPGAFVALGGAAWLVWDGALHAWTPAGYTERRAATEGMVTVVTPRCIVAVLGGGYRPMVHPDVVSDST
jgi:hypothetical protein